MERKELISYISLISFSILFLIFLVWPKYQQFLEFKKAIFKLEEAMQSYEEYIAKIKETFSKVKEKEEEVEKIKKALPFDPQIPETFNFLQSSASETGLILKNISLSLEKPKTEESPYGAEQPKEKKLSVLKIDLSLSGKYESLKNFLKRIENSSRLIEVENISFSGKEPFDFKLTLKTYFIQK